VYNAALDRGLLPCSARRTPLTLADIGGRLFPLRAACLICSHLCLFDSLLFDVSSHMSSFHSARGSSALLGDAALRQRATRLAHCAGHGPCARIPDASYEALFEKQAGQASEQEGNQQVQQTSPSTAHTQPVVSVRLVAALSHRECILLSGISSSLLSPLEYALVELLGGAHEPLALSTIEAALGMPPTLLQPHLDRLRALGLVLQVSRTQQRRNGRGPVGGVTHVLASVASPADHAARLVTQDELVALLAQRPGRSAVVTDLMRVFGSRPGLRPLIVVLLREQVLAEFYGSEDRLRCVRLVEVPGPSSPMLSQFSPATSIVLLLEASGPSGLSLRRLFVQTQMARSTLDSLLVSLCADRKCTATGPRPWPLTTRFYTPAYAPPSEPAAAAAAAATADQAGANAANPGDTTAHSQPADLTPNAKAINASIHVPDARGADPDATVRFVGERRRVRSLKEQAERRVDLLRDMLERNRVSRACVCVCVCVYVCGRVLFAAGS
jgi:DNA-binding IclR family transcriptional regulator